MRAALYARYSSDRQSERSIDDQLAVCRDHVARQGGQVVETYTDYALTGSVLHNRPGLAELLADARRGRFDCVVTEALDRLSRDQEDVAGLHKRLAHLDVTIVTLAEGEINELHVGLKGTMNALFLKDLAEKVRRGQQGRVRDGLSAGGLSYGYDVVRELDERGELLRGRRRINPAQAAVVRRIFAEAAAGRSGRAIAAGLNKDGVPAPRGPRWTASTINGNRARRSGILWNEAYLGFLVYNRTTMRRDPDTGKRIHRINPPEAWTVQAVPELRIVDDDTWNAVQSIKRSMDHLATHRRARPRRLLSGLVRCGACGGSFTIVKPDRFGCSAARQSGTCDNTRTISVKKLETRVLAGIKERLLQPDTLETFLKAFRAERRERDRAKARRQASARDRLADLNLRISRIVEAIETGTDTAELRARLVDLEHRKQDAAEELAAAEVPENVVALHPNMAEAYRKRVAALEDALTLSPDIREEAARHLRAIIDQIVVYPQESGGLRVELIAHMAHLAAVAGVDDAEQGMFVVVAGARYRHEHPPDRLRLAI